MLHRKLKLSEKVKQSIKYMGVSLPDYILLFYESFQRNAMLSNQA
jgi:hypothetical protein